MSQNYGAQMGGRARTMLLFMGILWLVIAAGLYLGLSGIPAAGGTITFLVVLFAIIGGVMIVAAFFVGRMAADTRRVATVGLPGTARIVGLTQTGMSLNDQPQIGMDLEVSVPGLPAYRAQHKEFVPLLLLARLQPGGMIAVRVDPANPHKLVVAWNEAPGAVPLGGFGGVQGPGMFAPGSGGASDGAGTASQVGGLPGATVVQRTTYGGPTASPAGAAAGAAPGTETLGQVAAALQAAGMGGAAAPVFASADQATYSVEQLRQWLRENGIHGTARIDHLADSGQTIGTDRLMTMQTTIEVPGRPAFRTAASAAMVPVEKVGRIAVGVTLPVLVAPDNPDVSMFEWDRI